jgi:hypothetical protein
MKDFMEKFQAYVAVQESGYYNMLDPRARKLAVEMSDIDISGADWVYMIKNYKLLKEFGQCEKS